MNTHFTVSLPPEIWLEIFDWATYNPHLLSELVPFQSVPNGRHDSSLSVRLAIASVCSTWKSWIAQSLYSDIEIRHGAHALQRVLEGRKLFGRYYGEMVQRVVLPYPSTVATPTRPLHSLEILKSCPNIHTLLRPPFLPLEGLRFEFEAETVELPSLRRLEWWHHGEAERTGGINSLTEVLKNTPNINSLFIGGVIGSNFSSRMCNDSDPVALPQLETLRLNIRSGRFFYRILYKWSLSNLRHIILDSPPVKEGLDAIWEVFGQQLETVEFGKHVRFLMSDEISSCLAGCPNLKQLNYYIMFTATPEHAQVHPNTTEVGIHMHVNSLLSDDGSAWGLIARHFDFLCGPFLPGLRKVLLHGDCKSMLSHPLFQSIQERLKSSGRVLEVHGNGV